MDLSVKSKAVSASPTMAIDAKYKAMLAEGVDVVGFGTGEPDFDTPDNIKKAAIDAIEKGYTKYTPASGLLALKKAVCKKFKNENGLDYEPSQIVISNGAKHSLVNAFQAILNPGDEVIIPGPYWVSYPEIVKLADGVPVELIATEEEGFKVTVDKLKSVLTDRTKAIIINSPCNPTGVVYSAEELKAIADFAVENDLFVISDEIYEHLIYTEDGVNVSIASFNDEIKKRTIVINGVSKSYAMTGWRIGYAAAEPEIAKIMGNVQSHAASNPSSISQYAAIEALNGPQESVESMRLAFKKRREYMVSRINSIEGVSCLMPEGAFYVMMNISKLKGKTIKGKLIKTSDDFCDILLDEAKVALVPGSGFGADDFVRWSYAASMEKIQKGLDRLENFLKA